MAFIPDGARWYIADVILEYRIEDDPRNVVHVNTLLVQAASPEEAFAKALELGRAEEQEYQNTDGKLVRTCFRGLRQLNVIYDELEHGAELYFDESVGMSEEAIEQWITPKEKLHVFAPMAAKGDVPNYMPESVMKMLEAAGFSREDVEGNEA